MTTITKAARKHLPIIKRGDSLYDRFWAYTCNPEDKKNALTPKEDIILNRWKVAFTMRCNGSGRSQIIEHFEETFDIKQSQAYSDIQNSEHFFGNYWKADKEGTRVILREWAEQLYRKALEASDLKIQAKAIELIAHFEELGKDDEKQFNPEKFANDPVTISLPTAVLDKMVDSLKSGVMDFNEIPAEDVPYTEMD